MRRRNQNQPRLLRRGYILWHAHSLIVDGDGHNGCTPLPNQLSRTDVAGILDPDRAFGLEDGTAYQVECCLGAWYNEYSPDFAANASAYSQIFHQSLA